MMTMQDERFGDTHVHASKKTLAKKSSCNVASLVAMIAFQFLRILREYGNVSSYQRVYAFPSNAHLSAKKLRVNKEFIAYSRNGLVLQEEKLMET